MSPKGYLYMDMNEDGIIVIHKTSTYLRFVALVDNIMQDLELDRLLNEGWTLVSHTVVEQDTDAENLKDRYNQYILKL